jgi:hypothetical protein
MGLINPYGSPIQPAFKAYLDGPLIQVQSPIGRAVSLREAKLACRSDDDITADDPRILGLIDEATDWFEKRTGGRQILTAIYQMPVRMWWGGLSGQWHPGYPGITGISYGRINGDGSLRLPRPPLQSVSWIKYYDSSDNLQTLSTSGYLVRTAWRQPGEVDIGPFQVWPALSTQRAYPILIQFVSGVLTPVRASSSADTFTSAAIPFEEDQTVTFSATSDGEVPTPLVAGVNYYVVNPTNGGLTFQVSLTPGGAVIDLTNNGSSQVFVGQVPPNIRGLLLRKIAHGYRNREPSSADDFERKVSESLAALEEWGAY